MPFCRTINLLKKIPERFFCYLCRKIIPVKNISVLLNIFLFAAVAGLYYLHFYGSKTQISQTETATVSDTGAPTPPSVPISSIPKNTPIVFINADSVFAHYEYAQKARNASDAKAAGLEKTYQDKVMAFQKEYQEYMEKAGAGMYTKEQGLVIEEGLRKKQIEILEMEKKQGKFLEDVDKTNADVQKKIYDYLERFNKQHGYYCTLAFTKTGGGALGVNDSLDVTALVIQGLNEEYKAEKIYGKKNP